VMVEAEGCDRDSTTATADTAAAVGSESLYASMYGSGLLLSADDVAGALQMSALPAAASAADSTAVLPAVNTSSGSVAAPAAAAPAPAAAEPWQGDASLYASIIAHSEDHEQPGSPFNFGESFAAALSAAGLDSLGGPSPPSGSPRGSASDDWQIVEADVEGAGVQTAAEPAAAAAAASSSKGSRSWMGGRAK
jgi:hypothetical protein